MVFKCKMCGGDIVPIKGTNTGKCEYCKSVMTLPNLDDEKIVNLYNRANFLRIGNDFDKAREVYENILTIDNKQVEAHWGILLCKYGVEYVDDPKTGKKVPTCHRTIDASILSDKDFKIIKKESYGDALELYKKEAETIDKIQKNILEISLKEKPYDIFICYKESDDKNERTHDSVIAQDIYDKLIEQGFKVFFSRITLEDKLGVEYEPYIYSALKSSKVMLVVGTKEEYFNATWVKNEWSRYLEMMKQDKGKSLIPVYSKIDPYKIPEEFAMLQAQSMDKVGAMQDLIRGVKKLVNEYKQDGVSEYDQETIAKVASALDDARSIGNGKYEVTIVKENLALWYYTAIIIFGVVLFLYYVSFVINNDLIFLKTGEYEPLKHISMLSLGIHLLSYVVFNVALLSCIVKRKFIKYKKLLLITALSLHIIAFINCFIYGYYIQTRFIGYYILCPLVPFLFAYIYNPTWKLNISNKTIMDKDEKDIQIEKNKILKEKFTTKEKGKLEIKILLIPIIVTIVFGLYALYMISPINTSNRVNDDIDYIELKTTKYIYSGHGQSALKGYVRANDKFVINEIYRNENSRGDFAGDYIKIKTNKGITGWIKIDSDLVQINFKNHNVYNSKPEDDIKIVIDCNVKGGKCEKHYLSTNERDKSKNQVLITTNFINIREGSKVYSKILGKVHKGDIYTILEYNESGKEKWYKIMTSNGITGWIAGIYEDSIYVEVLEKE